MPMHGGGAYLQTYTVSIFEMHNVLLFLQGVLYKIIPKLLRNQILQKFNSKVLKFLEQIMGIIENIVSFMIIEFFRTDFNYSVDHFVVRV